MGHYKVYMGKLNIGLFLMIYCMDFKPIWKGLALTPLFVGLVDLDIFTEPSFETILRRNAHVLPGGQWKPTGCVSYQKVAIIFPYRNRLHQLKILLDRLHSLLRKQSIDYQIFLIEQVSIINYLPVH